MEPGGPNYTALWPVLNITLATTAVDEQAGHYLHHVAKRCPDTYAFAIELACQQIGMGVQMPAGLRDFVCGVLLGHVKRPTRRGQSRGQNWGRDYVILEMLEHLVDHFGVRPTRNDETKDETSACDLVSQAFREAGYHNLTFKTIKGIWLNKALRIEARTIRALFDSPSNSELPAFVELREPPFPVS
jgi:hypothetical protein